MNLVDENNYPLLEGTINLTRSPIDILVDYIKVRYETNQSFDNLVNKLKEKELAYTAMTPKEKAKDLLGKFKIGDVVTEKLQIVNIDIYSKLFALIAVDEIFKTGLLEGSTLSINKKYWQEVKTEIENL